MVEKTNKPVKVFFPVETWGLEPGSVNVVRVAQARDPFPKHMANIPQDTILTISCGAYSDYYVSGVYKALKEIDPNLLIRGWLEKYPEQKENYNFRHNEFLTWLEEISFLERLDSTEWYMGSYSDASSMTVM